MTVLNAVNLHLVNSKEWLSAPTFESASSLYGRRLNVNVPSGAFRRSGATFVAHGLAKITNGLPERRVREESRSVAFAGYLAVRISGFCPFC